MWGYYVVGCDHVAGGEPIWWPTRHGSHAEALLAAARLRRFGFPAQVAYRRGRLRGR